MSLDRERETAIRAVREASFVCRAVQAELPGAGAKGEVREQSHAKKRGQETGVPGEAVLQKQDRSPVTVADFGSQAVICRALMEAFPDDPIIGEEDAASLRKPENQVILRRVTEQVAARVPGAMAPEVCAWIDRGSTSRYHERFWTLDPIDGTKGFLRHEQYAIALALIVGGEIAIGVMACPSLPHPVTSSPGALFVAIRGRGACVLALDDPAGKEHHLAVSSQREIAQARLCESVESGHSSHDDSAKLARRLGITAAPVRMDSQAKYGLVASGRAEIYLRVPTRAGYSEKVWDHAAGALVVAEAGGRVTDLDGKALDFAQGPTLLGNRGVLVTNGPLHDTMLDACRGIRAPA